MAAPIKHYGKWRIRWTDENGQRHSASFDNHKDAAYCLRQKELEAENIKRGFKAPVIANKTFAEICEYWLTHRTAFKRSPRDDQLIIKNHLLPCFGHVRLVDINLELVDQYKISRQHLNQKTVNNHLTLLISLLNFAKQRRWVIETPKIKKYRVPLFSKDFRYLKSDDEVRRFLIAAKDTGNLSWALYATAIYTGMRQGELAGLQWSDIDFDRRLIVVQRSFGGLTKGGDVRYVPILDALLPILRAWRLQCQNTFVFPNEACKMQLKCARIFDEIFHRTLDAAGFPKVTVNNRQRPYIRFHDLRHTFASHWVMKGGDIFKLQKILGHKSIQMTMRYAHLSPSAFASDHKIFDNLNPPQNSAKVLQINS